MALTSTVGSYEGLPKHWKEALEKIPKEAPFSYVVETLQKLAIEDIRKCKENEYFVHSDRLMD